MRPTCCSVGLWSVHRSKLWTLSLFLHTCQFEHTLANSKYKVLCAKENNFGTHLSSQISAGCDFYNWKKINASLKCLQGEKNNNPFKTTVNILLICGLHCWYVHTADGAACRLLLVCADPSCVSRRGRAVPPPWRTSPLWQPRRLANANQAHLLHRHGLIPAPAVDFSLKLTHQINGD